MTNFFNGVLSALILILLVPVALTYGELVATWVSRTLVARLGSRFGVPAEGTTPARETRWTEYLSLGLLIWIVAIFWLTSCGIALRWATALTTAVAFVQPKRLWSWMRSGRPISSLNFLLWFIVTLSLGIALMNTVSGISTPWVNNYGDLTWHLGMISAFVRGGHLPPINHIYAGERLSYPFLVNLWSAAHWAFLPSFTLLGWIVLFQWMLVWIVVFWALDGDRNTIAPWAILFGGGSFVIVARLLGLSVGEEVASSDVFAHALINKGYPWAPFLTTIWAPQRTALLGVMILVVSLRAFHRGYRAAFLGAASADGSSTVSAGANDLGGVSDIVIASMIVGLSPLVHSHFFAVMVLYLVGMIGFATAAGWRDPAARNRSLVTLLCVGAAFLPSLTFLPWILSKAHLVHVSGGWMQEGVLASSGWGAAIAATVQLWYRNALPWLILTAVLVAATREWRWWIVLTLIFLIGNVVQVAVWNWDQIKVFIASYVIFVSYWCVSVRERPAARIAQWGLIVLIVPSIAELGLTLSKYQNYTVYTADEMILARRLSEIVPPDKVIAAAPDHNSPVTLSGRTLYYGYEGTLRSHGIAYESRRTVQVDLARLLRCRRDPAIEREAGGCPDYLLWTGREQRYWKGAMPQTYGAVQTELDTLYEVPK